MSIRNFVIVAVALYAVYYYFVNRHDVIIDEAITYDMTSSAVAAHDGKHVEIFKEPKVIKVTEGVYVAVGFALGNSILIEGLT